jgi:cell division protein FtsL
MTDWADGIEMRNYGIKNDMDVRMLSELMRIIVALAMVAGALLFYSWIRNQIINVGYESQNLIGIEKSLLRDQKRLILEEQTLRDPERIDMIARNDLGMVPTRPGQMIPLPNQDFKRGSSSEMAMSAPVGSQEDDLKRPGAGKRFVNYSN